MDNSKMKLFICETGVNQFYSRLDILKDFINYSKNSLSIKKDHEIYLVDNRQNYNIKTVAYCDHDFRKIFVYVKGRAFSDVLRSIAHEMVHIKQHEEGEEIDHEFLHFHSHSEDEANMLSVSLFNAYAEVKGNDIIFEN